MNLKLQYTHEVTNSVEIISTEDTDSIVEEYKKYYKDYPIVKYYLSVSENLVCIILNSDGYGFGGIVKKWRFISKEE